MNVKKQRSHYQQSFRNDIPFDLDNRNFGSRFSNPSYNSYRINNFSAFQKDKIQVEYKKQFLGKRINFENNLPQSKYPINQKIQSTSKMSKISNNKTEDIKPENSLNSKLTYSNHRLYPKD